MNRQMKTWRSWAVMVVLVTVCWFALPGTRAVQAGEATDARQLVEAASRTFENFQAAPEMDALRDLLPMAKGVFIAPQVLKGAFMLGISGGSGVLLARDRVNSEWHGPAFYTIGEVSYGLQLGGNASEVVLLALTDRGVTAFLSHNLKLGADIGVAAGPVGIGASAGTANLSADIISFSRSKGAFGGISVNGAVVAPRPTLNQAFYGTKVDPTDILIRHRVTNPQASDLIDTVSKRARRR